MICAAGISLWMLLFNVPVMAQGLLSGTQQTSIQPLPLSITYGKTTNLIFPYMIKSVDKGSRDVLVQIAKGVENILQVKAAKQGFEETNLTVVTADGKLYSYVLNYTANPVALNIKLGSSLNYPKTDALFSYKSDNEAKVYDITEQIALKKPLMRNIRCRNYEVSLSLSAVYIKEDRLYFQFAFGNNSNVDYNIDAFRFYIRDQKKSKRTSSQENEVLPLQLAGNVQIIRGNSEQSVVVVLPKFTIPDKKLLFIQLMEQSGGRNLELKIKNKIIEAQTEGNHYLCYWSEADYFKKEDLKAFNSHYDAVEYCYENSTDRDTYDITRLIPIQEVVEDFKLSLKDLGDKEPNTMEMQQNEKNEAYLENQVLHTGFGDIPRQDLINNIRQGEKSFELHLDKQYGDDDVHAVLHFTKSDKGNYFFNSYDLAIKKEGQEHAFKQTFKVNYGNTFTLKEAYNLMEGRSVNKDFIKVDQANKENNQKYNAWATMDFKDIDANGNCKIVKSSKLNLEQALAEYPIKELQNPQYKEDLIDSISRGNRQMVNFIKGDKEEKMYVEANPQHNALKFFDANGNKIGLSLKSKSTGEANDLNADQKVSDNDPASGNTRTITKKEDRTDEQQPKKQEMPRKARKVG
eukprot:gene17066-20330_t